MPLWENWSMTFDDRLPIYRQIALRFCRAFARGEIPAGERLPSIRDMSAALRVNTNTMQRVYQEMERDGLIFSKRGTGYFITEDVDVMSITRKQLFAEALGRFVEEMRALGCKDDEIIGELEAYLKGEKSK